MAVPFIGGVWLLGIDPAVVIPVTPGPVAWSVASATGALVSTLLVKASPGILREAQGLLSPAAVGVHYLMVFNKAAAPVNGDTPLLAPIPVFPGQFGDFDEGADTCPCSVGISLGFSTTAFPFTAPGGAVGLFSARFQ